MRRFDIVSSTNSRSDIWLGADCSMFKINNVANSQKTHTIYAPNEVAEFEESSITGLDYYQNWIQLLLWGLIDLAQRNGTN